MSVKPPRPRASIYLLNLNGKYGKSRNLILANMHKPRNSSPASLPSERSPTPLPSPWQAWAGSARVGRQGSTGDTGSARHGRSGSGSGCPAPHGGCAGGGSLLGIAHRQAGVSRRQRGLTGVVVLLYPGSPPELGLLVRRIRARKQLLSPTRVLFVFKSAECSSAGCARRGDLGRGEARLQAAAAARTQQDQVGERAAGALGSAGPFFLFP